VQLVLLYPLATEMLVGQRPLLAGRMPAGILAAPGRTAFGACNATCWAHGAAPVWRAIPGAIDWLRRVRTTAHLAFALSKRSLDDDGTPVPLDVDASVAAIRRGDVIVTAVIDEFHTLTHVAASGNHSGVNTHVRVVEALLDAGGPLRNPRTVAQHGPGPMERACYYAGPGCDPAVAALLVRRLRADAANDAGKDDDARWSAAQMAAVQGNAEALISVLTDLAAHVPQSAFVEGMCDGDCVLARMLGSSVFACVSGGTTCQRCEDGNRPHAGGVSLERTFRAIMSVSRVAQGILEPTAETLALSRATMQQCGHRRAGIETNIAAWQRAWKPCAGCGAVPFKPMRCARCRGAAYCSAACQRAAWPEHKLLCAPARK